MKVQGTHSFAASREEVWSVLVDPEMLSQTLPGIESLEQVSDDEYAAQMSIRLGPVQGRFSGTVVLSEIDPPTSYRLSLRGQGVPGFIEGNGRVRLGASETKVGHTDLEYELDVNVGGRLASVGQRLLESTSRVLTREALANLETQISIRGSAVGNSEIGVDRQSEMKFASRVTCSLLRKLWAPLTIGGLLLLIVMLFFWLN